MPSDQIVRQYADRLTALLWPVLENLGFSGGVGIAAGLAFKVVLWSARGVCSSC